MRLLFVLMLLCTGGVSLAADTDLDRIKAELAKSFPEVAAGTLRSSPVPGVYELLLDAKIYYVTGDGKHMFLGDLIDVKKRANLSEAARQGMALQLINSIGEQNMIVMSPAVTRNTITVFTDVDCPYCLRLHQEVPELNKQGVKVRYLLYPRAGIGSNTYKRSVAVWCASDRVKAIGLAKGGGRLELKTCKHPVDSHYHLGERLDISGTPTIFLENGKKIPGYVPAVQLLSMIRKESPQSTGLRE